MITSNKLSIAFAISAFIIYCITNKSDLAIMNLLIAIWFKLPYHGEK
jgi:hypothetical protein